MDTFTVLNGKLTLKNTLPRPTEDPLWLAASIPPLPSDTTVLDAGTGTGLAALALLIHQPHLNVTALDIDPILTALAAANAALNNLTLHTHTADILSQPNLGPFEAILCNPPYHGTERGHQTASPARTQAHSLPAGDLTRWLHALTTLLTPAGSLHLILHTACQPELTTFAQNHSFTATITPLQTHHTRPPKRLLTTLQKSSQPTIHTNPPIQAFNPQIRQKTLG